MVKVGVVVFQVLTRCSMRVVVTAYMRIPSLILLCLRVFCHQHLPGCAGLVLVLGDQSRRKGSGAGRRGGG